MTKLSKAEIINTRAELAKIVGVSEGTYDKGKKILNSDNEELKQEVLTGEKRLTLFTRSLQDRIKKSTPKEEITSKDGK